MTFSCKWLWTVNQTAAPSHLQYVFCMSSAFILVMILFLFWYNWGTAWLPFIRVPLFTTTDLPSGSFKNEKLPPTYFAIWFLFFLSKIMVLQCSATYVALIIFTSSNNPFFAVGTFHRVCWQSTDATLNFNWPGKFSWKNCSPVSGCNVLFSKDGISVACWLTLVIQVFLNVFAKLISTLIRLLEQFIIFFSIK